MTSQKILTLTVPHIGCAEDRVRLLWAALRHLQRRLEWWRWDSLVFEWARGDDAGGHPHIHAQIDGPFLPWDRLREWWTASLVEAGVSEIVAATGFVEIRRGRFRL